MASLSSWEHYVVVLRSRSYRHYPESKKCYQSQNVLRKVKLTILTLFVPSHIDGLLTKYPSGLSPSRQKFGLWIAAAKICYFKETFFSLEVCRAVWCVWKVRCGALCLKNESSYESGIEIPGTPNWNLKETKRASLGTLFFGIYFFGGLVNRANRS